GKGVKTINVTDKTGNLIAIKTVTDANDLMIITKEGITIRMAVSTLRVMGRATQGVRLINIDESDEIAAVTKVDHEDEVEETIEGAEGDIAPTNGTDTTPTAETDTTEIPSAE
ncbi:MAG TPA: DNA gyrase C-terminal beta-propeller domain-containing protein, partial [Bacteroidia bacterium]|nr:DNA gyrase C-terminal beta-propeller domain-containing protein [Bacteroidia bacterium]